MWLYRARRTFDTHEDRTLSVGGIVVRRSASSRRPPPIWAACSIGKGGPADPFIYPGAREMTTLIRWAAGVVALLALRPRWSLGPQVAASKAVLLLLLAHFLRCCSSLHKLRLLCAGSGEAPSRNDVLHSYASTLLQLSVVFTEQVRATAFPRNMLRAYRTNTEKR